MKTYCSILFFLIPFCLFAQKDAMLKRTQYYNAGMAVSARIYEDFLHRQYSTPASYKIYENQYRRQQQRIAVLADQWAFNPGKSKKISSALALVAKADVTGAIKLMEGALKGKHEKEGREEVIFLAELNELAGAYDKAEKLLDDNGDDIEEGLYHCWLLASTGAGEQALAKTEWLSRQPDTITLVRIRLQRSYIDTMQKDYTAAKAALIEAQYLLGKINTDSMQQVLSGTVLGNLAHLQSQGDDIDNAYRNAQNAVAVFDKTNDLQRKAWAYSILAKIYKKAGANQQADTSFQKSIAAYTALAAAYPQQYTALLADVMNEYAEIQKWFDRKKEYKDNLEKIVTIRKELAGSKYPFFTLQYAGSLGRLADQFVVAESDIITAEEYSKKQMNILAALYAEYPALAGNEYSIVLDHLGDISMTLKRATEGIGYLARALEVRQELYKLYPAENKYTLMSLLIRNGTANGLYGDNIVLAYQQLDRAGTIAAELNEFQVGQEIAKIKQHIKSVKK